MKNNQINFIRSTSMSSFVRFILFGFLCQSTFPHPFPHRHELFHADEHGIVIGHPRDTRQGFNKINSSDPNEGQGQHNSTIVDDAVINRVNNGVGTILRGVSSLRLSEILRGSFMFTRNDRVRTVANSVLDSIFGKRNNETELAKEPGIFPLREI